MIIRFSKYLELFGLDVKISVYDNMQCLMSAHKRYTKKYKLKNEQFSLAAGMMFQQEKAPYVFNIWFAKDQLDIELLSHECAHLTHAILEHHNMSKKGDHETFSLLNGYLNQVIANKLKKKGITLA